MIIAVSCSSEKGLKNSDLNPELSDASALLFSVSYQASWELVIMGADCKPDK